MADETESKAASTQRADDADDRAANADERAAYSARRADRADDRADSADKRATGADTRASGADERASAADTRADAAIAATDAAALAAHQKMIETLQPLERKLDRSITVRNWQVALIVTFFVGLVGVWYSDFYADRNRAWKACNERVAANNVLREVIIRATPPSDPPQPVRDAIVARYRAELLSAIPDVTCKKGPVFPTPW